MYGVQTHFHTIPLLEFPRQLYKKKEKKEKKEKKKKDLQNTNSEVHSFN